MENEYQLGNETNTFVPTEESEGLTWADESPAYRAPITTNSERKREAAERHNAEYERKKNRTLAEKEADFKEMVRGIAKQVTGEAHNALFGTGKPKKVKRWGKVKKKKKRF